MSKPYRGISDAQANAEALRRRDASFTGASDASFRVQWDFHHRQPETLERAVYYLRRAYAAEVPTKLHEGPDSIGDDGTPKMTARAVGYIFGSAEGTDAKPDPETGELPLISYYHSPFRALLSVMQHGSEPERKRAAIVQHVTIGQQPPISATIAEGVPSWCARIVATDVLFAFHRNMTDLKINAAARLANEESVA